MGLVRSRSEDTHEEVMRWWFPFPWDLEPAWCLVLATRREGSGVGASYQKGNPPSHPKKGPLSALTIYCGRESRQHGQGLEEQ